MDKIILLFASFISCVVIVGIMFQFWDDRYIKTYKNKYLYIILAVLNIFTVMSANMLINPVINLFANVFWVALISYFFYYDDSSNGFIRVLESAALFAVIGVTEAMGAYLIDFLLQLLHIVPESAEILQSLENTFSKIVVLFFYYVVFSRVWKKSALRTWTQYVLYLIMFIYGCCNVLATAIISNEEHPVILMIVIGCTIFANLYLLYFMKFSDERNYYKLQVEMMEQQERLQYENYEIQREKYGEALAILHDVKKHITVIEELYQNNEKTDAILYTKQINEMLRPLAPLQYVNNPIMNCLLSDKIRMAEKYGVRFEIEISTADVNFMKPIDITTLFGNLLDNAINACKKCNGEKYVGFYMHPYNEMLSVRVENSVYKPVALRNGKIADEQSGIGLLNIRRCIDTYNGSIAYKNKDHILTCDILLTETELS